MMITAIEIKNDDHGAHHGYPPRVNFHGQL